MGETHRLELGSDKFAIRLDHAGRGNPPGRMTPRDSGKQIKRCGEVGRRAGINQARSWSGIFRCKKMKAAEDRDVVEHFDQASVPGLQSLWPGTLI